MEKTYGHFVLIYVIWCDLALLVILGCQKRAYIILPKLLHITRSFLLVMKILFVYWLVLKDILGGGLVDYDTIIYIRVILQNLNLNSTKPPPKILRH